MRSHEDESDRHRTMLRGAGRAHQRDLVHWGESLRKSLRQDVSAPRGEALSRANARRAALGVFFVAALLLLLLLHSFKNPRIGPDAQPEPVPSYSMD